MYLHIGGKTSVLVKDVLAIFDKASLRSSRSVRFFIRRMRQEKKILGDDDEAVSYVFVCDESGKEKLYCSPISSLTLAKRSERQHTVVFE